MISLRLPFVLLLAAWSVGCAAYQLGRRVLGRFGPTMPFRLLALGWCLGVLVHEPMAGVLIVAVAWAWKYRDRADGAALPVYVPLSANLKARLVFGVLWLAGASACALQGWAGAVVGCAMASLFVLVGPRLSQPLGENQSQRASQWRGGNQMVGASQVGEENQSA